MRAELSGYNLALQGQRVHLDLSKLPSYRLFPGQIVAVKGVNPNGKELMVQDIVNSVLPAPDAISSAPAPAAQLESGTPVQRVANEFIRLQNGNSPTLINLSLCRRLPAVDGHSIWPIHFGWQSGL